MASGSAPVLAPSARLRACARLRLRLTARFIFPAGPIWRRVRLVDDPCVRHGGDRTDGESQQLGSAPGIEPISLAPPHGVASRAGFSESKQGCPGTSTYPLEYSLALGRKGSAMQTRTARQVGVANKMESKHAGSTGKLFPIGEAHARPLSSQGVIEASPSSMLHCTALLPWSSGLRLLRLRTILGRPGLTGVQSRGHLPGLFGPVLQPPAPPPLRPSSRPPSTPRPFLFPSRSILAFVPHVARSPSIPLSLLRSGSGE